MVLAYMEKDMGFENALKMHMVLIKETWRCFKEKYIHVCASVLALQVNGFMHKFYMHQSTWK